MTDLATVCRPLRRVNHCPKQFKGRVPGVAGPAARQSGRLVGFQPHQSSTLMRPPREPVPKAANRSENRQPASGPSASDGLPR